MLYTRRPDGIVEATNGLSDRQVVARSLYTLIKEDDAKFMVNAALDSYVERYGDSRLAAMASIEPPLLQGLLYKVHCFMLLAGDVDPENYRELIEEIGYTEARHYIEYKEILENGGVPLNNAAKLWLAAEVCSGVVIDTVYGFDAMEGISRILQTDDGKAALGLAIERWLEKYEGPRDFGSLGLHFEAIARELGVIGG